jgi:hypothetical protein
VGSIFVELSFQEAEFISDILEMWEQGLAPANDDTIADASIETAEELLTLSAGYDEQRRMVNEIREKIRTK